MYKKKMLRTAEWIYNHAFKQINRNRNKMVEMKMAILNLTKIIKKKTICLEN